MKDVMQYQRIFDSYGGMMRTKQLTAEKIFYASIQQLLNEGYITKIKTGCYRWAYSDTTDEVQLIRKLFPDGVLCMESALYLYGYLDERPQLWHLAVSKDSGKSRFQIEFPQVKPHYIQSGILKLGVSRESVDGCAIQVYNRERTICDCIRFRHKMDEELFKKAIKAYTADPKRSVLQLLSYAEPLRVKKYTQNLIGVWL